MTFPTQRLRRLRRTEAWRRAVRETALRVDDLVYPLFVVNGEGVRNPVQSMPGVEQLSIDELVKEAREVHDLGIPAVILFGVPDDDEKDAVGSVGYDPEGLTARAITAIKEAVPELLVWADVCLCEYTEHGHCGVLNEKGEVRNDESVALLARAAVVYADAGADAVAPSDMMDGRVGAIRDALDDAGHEQLPIVSYAAKYASAYYGPFRDAAHSAPSFGDRRGYQVKQTFAMPTAAYQVSGEFALIKAAAEKGWVDGDRVAMESLVAIKRAGADLILTYFAKDAARALGGAQ